jgi:hypothetical protein
MNTNELPERWRHVSDWVDRTKTVAQVQLEAQVQRAIAASEPFVQTLKAGFETRLAQAEAAGREMASHNLFSNNIFSESIQQWLAAHPLWAWSLSHPIVAGAIALASLFLLFKMLQGLLNPKTWLRILGFPVRLVAQWLTPSTRAEAFVAPRDETQTQGLQNLPSDPRPNLHSAVQPDVQTILARLHVLQQEQVVLYQQLQSLLKNAKL